MDELFGAPMTNIAAVLAVAFGLAVAFLLFIRVRNPILVRMAFRNVLRRPGQSLLILAGLMLATAMISSAFTVGDSVTYSIKNTAAASLRSVDELLVVDEDSNVWEGRALPNGFSESTLQELAPLLDADPDIDGVLPVLTEGSNCWLPGLMTATSSVRTGRARPATGRGLRRAVRHGGRSDRPHSPGARRGLDHQGRRRGVAGGAGGALSVALGPGVLTPVTVRGVVDGSYIRPDGTDVVLMATLSSVQESLSRPGELSGILISNRGDVFGGVDLTGTVIDRYRRHSAVGGSGLELAPVKRNVVDQANEAGSLFVSIFTTFGLFSIGVGLLLIFLIFSMLASERKSEMGMASALAPAT